MQKRKRRKASRLSPVALAVAGVSFVWPAASHASSLFWDADGSASGNAISGTNLGGTGNWDTSTTNWWDGASGSDQAWVNANNDDAIFTGTAGTVTVSTVTAKSLTFRTTNYVLSGGTITLAGDVGVINTNVASTTISGVVTGFTGLTKVGTGSLVLTGANNYTGSTTVAGGTLSLNNSGSGNMLDSASALNLSGGTLALGAGSGTQTVLSTTLNPGASNVTRPGGSKVLQMNAITRNVGSTVNFSAASIATTDRLNDTSSFSGILGGWAVLNGGDWARNSTNAADGAVTAYTNYNFNSNFSGWNAASNMAANSSTLGTPVGAFTINSLRFGGTGVTVNLQTQAMTVASGGILMPGTGAGNFSGTISNGIVRGSAGGDLIDQHYSSGNLTISAVVSDNTSATALTKSGTGTGSLVLTHTTNNYTGSTFVNAGTLNLSAASTNNIASSAAINIASGATLNVSGLTSSTIVLGANQHLAGKGSGTATVTGSVSAGSTNTLSLSDGLVGTLAISGGLTLSSTALNFDVGGAFTEADRITLGSASVGGTNAISIFAATGTSSLRNGDYTLISAPSGLTPGAFSLATTTLTIGATTYNLSLSNSTTAATILSISSDSNPPVPVIDITTANNTRVLASSNAIIAGTYGNTGAGDMTGASISDDAGTMTYTHVSPANPFDISAGSTGNAFSGTVATGAAGTNKEYKVKLSDGTNTDSDTATLDVVNQRTFTSPSTVDLGRRVIGSSVSEVATITTSGLHAVTTDSTLAGTISGPFNGLSLTGGPDAILGTNASDNINRTISGTVSGTAGSAIGGSFVMNATDELAGAVSNAANVNFTGTAIDLRTYTIGGSISGSGLLAGATTTGTASVSSSQAHSSHTDESVSVTGSGPDGNGITLTSAGPTAFAGPDTLNTSISGKVGYTALAGTFSGAVSSTGTETHYTGNRTFDLTYATTAAGLATANRTANDRATFGSALTADVGSNDSYAGLKSKVVGDNGINGGAEGDGAGTLFTEAVLLTGQNISGADSTVSMAWRTRNTRTGTGDNEKYPGDTPPFGLISSLGLASDVVRLTGMENGAAVENGRRSETDTFVLQMSYDESLVGNESANALAGKIFMVWLDTDPDLNDDVGLAGIAGGADDRWRLATDGNFYDPGNGLGDIQMTNVGGSWGTFASDFGITTQTQLNHYLGSWGVDTSNNVVWAVLNHNSDFAVVPEPASLSMVVFGAASLMRPRRKRRLPK